MILFIVNDSVHRERYREHYREQDREQDRETRHIRESPPNLNTNLYR
jgi:hypothetical protein